MALTRTVLFVLAGLLISAPILFAQTHRYVYRDPADTTRNCFLLIKPNEQPKGLVVRDYTRLPDTSMASPFQFTGLMVDAGWAVVYTVTSQGYPDLYYTDEGPEMLDSIIHEIISDHHIDARRIVMGGISASGTRSLRFAQFCEQGKSAFGLKLAGAFAVDPPLDLERFYCSAERITERNNEKSDQWEARLMLNVPPVRLGGSLNDGPEVYHKASVYARNAVAGGNAGFLKDVPVRFYHEPDVDWWLEERAADYYDFNSIDIVGCVQQIRDLGGKKVELVTTSGKGFDRNGRRKPHSWTIVDEVELANWIRELPARVR